MSPTSAPSLARTPPTTSPVVLGEAAQPRGFLDRIAAAERRALLARVQSARMTAAPPRPTKVYDFADTNLADVTLPDPIPTGPLRKTTLRYAIKLFHPMLLDCRTSTDERGRLFVHLRLSGDDQGTVVENVEITGEPPLSNDRELVACVRTTLESLELPPVDDIAPWDVYYPLVL